MSGIHSWQRDRPRTPSMTVAMPGGRRSHGTLWPCRCERAIALLCARCVDSNGMDGRAGVRIEERRREYKDGASSLAQRTESAGLVGIVHARTGKDGREWRSSICCDTTVS